VSTTIVIPVHGRAALTKRCLDAVLATVQPETEIVVVDDASPDETKSILASFGDSIRVVSLSRNEGFATACNLGVERAEGEKLVFLNNDTETGPGWLAALERHAEENPDAAVVGAKLLYPNGVVQHAGVVFGQDGYPHHLYAGFPADHPALNRSRPLQAVTAACALVRRSAFEQAGGFDTGYENSLEDVDLCLRIGATGGGVHYCHEAEVLHLESASRGRDDRFEASVALYRERWRDRVRRDDLSIYAEDRLLAVEYPDAFPLRIEISPLLATVDRGREEEIESLLETYAGQVTDLLQEVVRLTAGAGDTPSLAPSNLELDAANHAELLAHARRIEADIGRLQQLAADGRGGFEPSTRLGYREAVAGVRAAIEEHTPEGSAILVVSRGDRDLLRLSERAGAHFPQAEGSVYLGHHPADSAEAIEQLEQLRSDDFEYLVLPENALWWLEHYSRFAQHLNSNYRKIQTATCLIFDLR
jgi:GT2 family glycosyltransferase